MGFLLYDLSTIYCNMKYRCKADKSALKDILVCAPAQCQRPMIGSVGKVMTGLGVRSGGPVPNGGVRGGIRVESSWSFEGKPTSSRLCTADPRRTRPPAVGAMTVMLTGTTHAGPGPKIMIPVPLL